MDTKEIKELGDAYSKKRVRLTMQVKAKEDLEFASQTSEEVSLIVLAGPTGVGKSTIIEESASEYYESRRADMLADPSLQPLAYAQASASGDLDIDWSRLYRDLLRSLQDPFANIRSMRRDGRQALKVHEGETPAEAQMREQLESVMSAVKTERAIIDEAQHVVRGKGRAKPGDRLDVLKSNAQKSNAKLILVGTHDLPEYLEHSGQLARRTQVIRLDRYRFTEKAELNEFASAANAMFKAMPSKPKYPAVAPNIKFYHVGSIGCPGVLKDWLGRAYMHALRAKRNEITMDDLINTRLGKRALATINREVLASERTRGEDRDGPDAELQEAILKGLDYVPKDAQPGPSAKRAKQAKKNKPFERSGVRDTVS